MNFKSILLLFLLLLIPTNLIAQNDIPIAKGLKDELNTLNDPHKIMESFLGLPFRVDGVIDEHGQWTLFASPDTVLLSPGFNCSGLAVSASRFLFNHNYTLKEASFDRLNDSSADSAYGQDWDFGLDLILNLTEPFPRRLLVPEEQLKQACQPNSPLIGGPALRGVNLHSPDFDSLIEEIKTEKLYLFSISRPSRKFPIGFSHYHVGLIIADENGHKWLYHTTLKARTHRIDLASPQGLANLRKYFPNPTKGERKIIIIETSVN